MDFLQSEIFEIIIVTLAVFILTGLDKKVETYLVEKDLFNLVQFELNWDLK